MRKILKQMDETKAPREGNAIFNFEVGQRAKIKGICLEEKDNQIEIRPIRKIPIDYSVLDDLYDEIDWLHDYIKELEREAT